jgi:DNA mismatch endonuclease (patch repair protein)
MPRSNLRYWRSKLARNVERDTEHLAMLRSAGWRALVIWECETERGQRLQNRLKRFLR